MGRSTFSGPVRSTNGFECGTSGTQLTFIKKASISVVIPASAAAAEADVDVTVSGAAVGDCVIATPLDANAETGLMWNAWVGATDTVTIRMTNVNAANALNGSTSNWQILLIRS
jgi:hypothetical protein